MDSIPLPSRYLSPDPAASWGNVTAKQKRDLCCWVYMNMVGICFRNGMAVRSARVESSLMQVYSVQFLHRTQLQLDETCGTIFVGRYKIFDRPKDKGTPLDIDPKGLARLIGPSVPIDVEDCNIGFFPRLFRKNHPEDFYHPNNGVCFNKRGYVLRCEKSVPIPILDKPGINGKYLSLDRGAVKQFGKLLNEEVETTCGIVRVNYAMFEDAADSYLTLRLLEWHGEGDAANVYGRIRTYDTLISGGDDDDKVAKSCGDDDNVAKSVAFYVSRNNPMSVKPGQYIPLHRPGTVVPMGHSLKVEVGIFHTNNNNNSSNGDKGIVWKTCSFEARSLPEGTSLSVCEDDDEDEDDDESMEYDSSDEVEHHHIPASDVQFDGINESKIISGEWGKIELKVYWMPCWCRVYLDELDEVSMEMLK